MSLVTIEHISKAKVVVDLFGATVISWVLPSGKEMLYLSSLCDKTHKKPIRGGIPVIFPQFSNEGKLMKHGFARVSMWTNDPVVEEEGYSVCRFHLQSSEATKKIWDHDFSLVYTVRLNATSFSSELSIENTGLTPFDCQCLLHTYYSVPSISTTTVSGLKGYTGVESVTTGKRREYVENEERISFASETDVKFQNVNNPVHIHVNDYTIDLTITACENKTKTIIPDCVVWNAWIDKCRSIGDMEDEDYKRYVCVEPGCVRDYKTIESGCSLSLKQEMKVMEN